MKLRRGDDLELGVGRAAARRNVVRVDAEIILDAGRDVVAFELGDAGGGVGNGGGGVGALEWGDAGGVLVKGGGIVGGGDESVAASHSFGVLIRQADANAVGQAGKHRRDGQQRRQGPTSVFG